MKELTIKDIGHYFVIPIFLIGVLLFFNVKDTGFALGWVMCISLITLLLRKKQFGLTVVDIFVFLWLGYDILQLFISINPISVLHSIDTTVVVVMYYFVLRSYLNTEKKTGILIGLYSLFIVMVLLIALYAYGLFFQVIENTGWNNHLLDFKYLYRPIGFLNNTWNSFLISFQGILILALYYYREKKMLRFCIFLAIVGVTLNILLTFSRGAYIALAFWLAGIAILLFSPVISLDVKKKVGIIISFTLLLSMSLLPQHTIKNVYETIQFSKTVSQQRSTAGRINSMQAAKEVFKNHIVTGVGQGNYSLAVNPYLFENDDVTFTSFASSSVVQLGVEKGMIGLLIWGGILISFFILFIKEKRKDFYSYAILISLIAIGIRELFFATFFEYLGQAIIVFTLLAIYQNRYTEIPTIKLNFSKRSNLAGIFILLILLCVFITYLKNKQDTDTGLNRKYLECIQTNQLDSAEYYINRSSGNQPNLINKSMLKWLQYKTDEDTASLYIAKACLQKAIAQNPNDNLLKYNLAMVLKQEGKKDSAMWIVKQLSDAFPDNALYHTGIYCIEKGEKDKQERKKHLLSAIKTMPQLLETQLWANAIDEDNSLLDELLANLNTERLEDISDPIRLAKYGKIYFLINNFEMAEKYLLKSVEILPSLSNPWLYLSQIAYEKGDTDKGYRYMKYTSHSKSTRNKDNPKEEEYHFFSDKYNVQFQRWYTSTTLPTVVFNDFE
ncbi:O-antigen ligase family protein [Bacteroides bouchesdurhonensis]|uniref:O-antigen ligase family protein n=1 Tax=Bacteroides bouchesdurhonensis TaxID=1841855 RepID=UPI0011DC79B6|nr:O-antigen ligase family protein [Bacteroides bouchesdurhonensis]